MLDKEEYKAQLTKLYKLINLLRGNGIQISAEIRY